MTMWLVTAITVVAHTGPIDDGRLWVLPVERIVRIRTGEGDTQHPDGDRSPVLTALTSRRTVM